MLLIIFNIVLAAITIIITNLTIVSTLNDKELEPMERNASIIFDCIVAYIAIVVIVNQMQLMVWRL